MLTLKSFTGINNVLPPERLSAKELQAALNTDIDQSGALLRRSGYSEVSDSCHKNIWQADGFMLATVEGNDLVAIPPAGDPVVVQEAMGTARVWYVNLPDGRTAFSNGAITGVTDGGAAVAWGVERPASTGALTPIAGLLHEGEYQPSITYVRTADGLESAPAYGTPETFDGGFMLTGLPVLAGHTINVYLDGFLAGSTANNIFTFAGANHELVSASRTDYFEPAPAGRCLALWRGRCLVAKDKVLYASRPHEWQHFDVRRDFKQFSGEITSVVPVDGGIFVGTTAELAFLAGAEFDKLQYQQAIPGWVVLGSGVQAPSELIAQRDGAAPGTGAIFIAGGVMVAGYSNGFAARLTESRYRTAVTEVAATFRMVDGIPQYVAVPQ